MRYPADQRSLTEGRFPVRYYLVAMTFIIFDIEVVVFMYPWAASFNHSCSFGLVVMMSQSPSASPTPTNTRGGLDY